MLFVTFHLSHNVRNVPGRPSPAATTIRPLQRFVLGPFSRRAKLDLHRLVLYKERNALLTMRHSAKREKREPVLQLLSEDLLKVRKSMARIRAVLAERRKAYKSMRLQATLLKLKETEEP